MAYLEPSLARYPLGALLDLFSALGIFGQNFTSLGGRSVGGKNE